MPSGGSCFEATPTAPTRCSALTAPAVAPLPAPTPDGRYWKAGMAQGVSANPYEKRLVTSARRKPIVVRGGRQLPGAAGWLPCAAPAGGQPAAGTMPGGSHKPATFARAAMSGVHCGVNLPSLLCLCRWVSAPSRSLWTARATRWGAWSQTWPGCSEWLVRGASGCLPHQCRVVLNEGACKQALEDGLACAEHSSNRSDSLLLTWRRTHPLFNPAARTPSWLPTPRSTRCTATSTCGFRWAR